VSDTVANIRLEYPVKVYFAPGFDTVLFSKNGCEVFMDEHMIQWVKFVPQNGYDAGKEHMIRTSEVVIVRNDDVAQTLAE
jgi:hypothetical protein